MLPAARRIRRAQDFRAVLRGPVRAATPTLVIHAGLLPGAEAGTGPGTPARAGFVVNRAVGDAVVRHRVTRRLRHLAAARLDDLPAGVGIVVRALPSSGVATSDALARDLDRGLERVARTLGPRTGTSVAVSQ